MTINEIIEKVKFECIIYGQYDIDIGLNEEQMKSLDFLEQLKNDLESAQQTQNELIERLIKCYQKAYSENDIKFIEKTTGKKWEEILNEKDN